MTTAPVVLSSHPRSPELAPADADDAARRAAFPVALVSMPFGPQAMPSIQLGLLASIARQAGFPVDTHHLGLELAVRIGAQRYESIAGQGSEMGNWVFSRAAFGDEAPDPEATRLPEIVAASGVAPDQVDATCDWLRHLRDDEVDPYLDELMDSTDWGRYRVVGFTLTYQQKTASFALAKRIKARWPHVQTLFGGANFDEPMGEAWMEAIGWIDLGINGEADLALPELLMSLSAGKRPEGIAGVLHRDDDGGLVVEKSERAVDDLSWLPVPDYDEFFERAERLGLLRAGPARSVRLPFQAARGCWWGEKSHCTFCGIADETLRYRTRPAARVAEELAALTRRYRSFEFLNTDLILDLGHLEELLGEFERTGVGYSFWWESKANLSRQQVRGMRMGGLHTVQPGIEALNSESLRLMRKGARAATNVNLLRWCGYYGIDVKWNRIVGFPGETRDAITAEAAMMRSLWHLTPPGNAGGISLDRYSPLFEDEAQFPRRDLRPSPGFLAVYPPTVAAHRAAFSFEAELDDTLPRSEYDSLFEAVTAWGAAFHARPRPRRSPPRTASRTPSGGACRRARPRS